MLSLRKSKCFNYITLKSNTRLFNSKIFSSIQNPTLIAIPDVPNVSNDPHSLQDYKRFPNFPKMTPDEIFKSMSKALQVQETKMTEFCDLRDRNANLSHLNEFEKVIVPTNSAFQTANIISKINFDNNSFIIMNSLAMKLNTAKRDCWTNDYLYKLCRDLQKKSSSKMSPQENALLDLYMRYFDGNGMKLNPATRDSLHMINNHLNEKQSSLIKRILVTGSFVKFTIPESELAANTPAWFKNKVKLSHVSANEGPMVLKYCRSRNIRQKMWKELNERDAFESNIAKNTIILGEIRRIQRNFVEMLGYDSCAEFYLEGQMAGSVEKVMTMVEGYKKVHYENSKQEANALNEWAQQKFHIQDGIRGWDINFLLEQRKEESLASFMYNVAPLSTVLKNIFSTCEDLFGVKIESCSTNSIDGEMFLEGFSTGMLQSESCEIYRVRDGINTDHVMGYFVCDLYAREKKESSMRDVMPLRCRSSAAGTLPVLYWMDSLSSIGSHSSDILISISDVARMCCSVGRILESICTTADYWMLSDPVEQATDVQGVTGSLLQKLLMSSNTFYHRITGAQLPDGNQLVSPVHNIEMMNEIYTVAMDLELAVSEKFWLDIQKKLSIELLPIPLEKNDLSLCYDKELFGNNNQPGRRYAALWMNMIADDMVEPFLDAGLSQWKMDTPIPEKLKAVSTKYRTNFISQMGVIPPGELFRSFRGRDHVRSPADISRRK